MKLQQISIGFMAMFLAMANAFGATLPEADKTEGSISSGLERVEFLDAEFKRMVQDDTDISLLKSLAPEASELRKTARDCIDVETSALERASADLEKLGEAGDTEDAAIAAARKELEEEKSNREKSLLACRLLLLEVDAFSDRLGKHITSLRTKALLARFPSALAVATGPSPDSLVGMEELVQHHEQQLAFPRLESQWKVTFAIVVAVALGLVVFFYRYFGRMLSPLPGPSGSFGSTMRFSFSRALIIYGGPVSAVFVITAFWAAASFHLKTFVPELGISFTVLAFFSVLLAGRTFLSPVAPAVYFLPFGQAASLRFWRAIRFLAVVWCSASILYFTPFLQLPLVPSLNLRLAYTVLFAIALGRLVWVFFELSPRKGFGLVRFIVMLILATGVIAELIGYRNLSTFLMQGVIVSIGIISAAWLTGRMTDEFLRGLEEGRSVWQKRFHRWVGLEEGTYLPGVFWLRLLVNLSITIATIWFVAIVWGMPEDLRDDILNYFIEGFQIGEVTIVPFRILIAFALLAFLFSGLSWFRGRLEDSVLSKSHASIGAKNAVSSIASYIIATLAFLFALSVAGVDLGNLALIAGALSVGIGFGLQNVVNNFVSGLILLFERPIKQGDWIVVGTTEGYVKKISVRSTQITTFDNADVIVPNSELISNQVTNWMLYDLRGRVRVPIGVAYGSDVEKVREILLRIALTHPQVVVDVNAPKPAAIFLGFGDSSMNFEVRFYIHNIDQRLNVTSDVNFAIEKAFRESNITIPYPQTDVYLHYDPKEKKQGDSVITDGSIDADNELVGQGEQKSSPSDE